MLRWLSAGESHGPSLTGILEGVPAGVQVTTEHIRAALARRRLGYGRGARMTFEQDQVSLVGGVRHGCTLGGPVALSVANTEWPQWEKVMAADPVDADELRGLARNAPLTRPRPGHADLTGMQKYRCVDARDVLERASARETAMRVALAAVLSQFLDALGVHVFSHTTAIGQVSVPEQMPPPRLEHRQDIDTDPLRCAHPQSSPAMLAHVDAARRAGQTVGGVVEVVAVGLPPGLGSYSQWDRRLDARLAGALMSIPAIKGVEIGDGFAAAARLGGCAHDEIELVEGSLRRTSNRAGGIEGGMSTGGRVRARLAMKPIATVPRALKTVDVVTGESAQAHHQRSDVCAVPAAGVVAEAMVTFVVAEAVLEKFGGDHVDETRENVRAYRQSIPPTLRSEGV